MSDLNVDAAVLVCPKCGKGKEVCTFCFNQDWTVFQMICDCGLVADGEHTIPCEVVMDERAHAALKSDPRLDAEAEHKGHRTPSGEWTEEDDVLVGELLNEDET